MIDKIILTFIVLLLSILLVGCGDVSYSRSLVSIAELENYLTSETQDTKCFNDGFDTLCIHLIPGPPGKDGKDGVNTQIKLRDVNNGTEIQFGTGFPTIWTHWYLIPNGKDGSNSIVPGPPGKDGADSQVEIQNYYNGIKVRFGIGEPTVWSEWTLIRNGEDGSDGSDGSDGEDGSDGKDGEDGSDGKDGSDNSNNSDNSDNSSD